MQQPSTIQSPSGNTIAFEKFDGQSPGVIFLGGFRSDMSGTKATTLERWCQENNRAFIRYDYSGHGVSSGKFEQSTIGDWLQDTLAVLDQIAVGPQVLVGSSMGGWMMLLAAIARPERVAGLLGIATAADFTEDLLWNALTPEQQQSMSEDNQIILPSDYLDDPTIVRRSLIDEGRNHLVLRQAMEIHCPIRLVHSMDDPDVPWQTSVRVMEKVATADVQLQLLKDAGHRLSRPQDLDLILSSLGSLLAQIEAEQ